MTPTLDYVMKYTDQGPYLGNHWFWRDGRRNHGHNALGQAYLRWRVRPTAASGYAEHGDFTVARLLIEARAPIPRGVVHENGCGLPQCVNPDHWRVRAGAGTWRLQVIGEMWQLVRVRTGAPARREIVVHAALGTTVHLVAVTPLDQRGYGPPHAACGAALLPETLVVTLAALTCPGCA